MCQAAGGWMQELGAHEAHVSRQVMLGEGVSKIGDSGAVVHQKLLLAYAVLDPMETHVHGF
jgi:hypothetical protein